jgi:hypothetical protein
MSFGDYISSRNLPLIVAAAGVLGVTVLGISSRLVAAKEEEEDEVAAIPSKSILSDQSTRPTSVVLSPTPSPQQSPIMFANRGSSSVPGDSLFFQILESYSGARNSVFSPGLTLSSGTSTPSLEPSGGGGVGQGTASSGRRKRRSKNSKKRNTAVTSN